MYGRFATDGSRCTAPFALISGRGRSVCTAILTPAAINDQMGGAHVGEQGATGVDGPYDTGETFGGFQRV